MTGIDVNAGRARFEESTDFTVGLEEEFAILDAGSLDLSGRFEDLRDAAASDPLLAAAVAGELISSEIEIRSGRGETLADAIHKQRELRRRLFALAGRYNVKFASTGTHPWADYREQRVIETDHYRRVERGLRYVAWRNNTFALHVHVGVKGADRAIQVCDRLRPVLPQLLAISANSPFLEGREVGLHSVRTQIFTKSFPRCGVPDAFGDWRTYAEYLDLLVGTESVVEYTQLWWSVRPHLDFGTVEVRICDAQPTAQESEALATLIVACVGQAARDVDEGRPHTDLPPRLIEENMWRAIRFGMDGQLIDFDRKNQYPARDVTGRLLEWTAPVRVEMGLEPRLPDANGAQRQRALRRTDLTMSEVYAAFVQATHATYGGAGYMTVEVN
ncbi:MAG: carboxylate-amine ligase [Solirubrobacteraceae bacterium]